MIASPHLSALKEVAQFIGKKIDDAVSKLASKREDLTPAINAQGKMLSSMVSRIENSVDKIKDLKVSTDVSIDTSSLERELKGIAKDLKKVKIPDLKTVESLLSQTLRAIKEMKLEVNMDSLAEAISKIKTYETVKIDEMQLRALSSGGISLGGQGIQPARNITMTNLALTATASQYSHTFPANTVRWTIKLRDQGTLAYYSYTTGTLPTVGGGGDGSKYATIPQNFLQSEDNVDWTGKVIYLGAESASQVAEITTYQL